MLLSPEDPRPPSTTTTTTTAWSPYGILSHNVIVPELCLLLILHPRHRILHIIITIDNDVIICTTAIILIIVIILLPLMAPQRESDHDRTHQLRHGWDPVMIGIDRISITQQFSHGVVVTRFAPHPSEMIAVYIEDGPRCYLGWWRVGTPLVGPSVLVVWACRRIRICNGQRRFIAFRHLAESACPFVCAFYGT